jgi:upstream activation factor subunit UAF30
MPKKSATTTNASATKTGGSKSKKTTTTTQVVEPAPAPVVQETQPVVEQTVESTQPTMEIVANDCDDVVASNTALAGDSKISEQFNNIMGIIASFRHTMTNLQNQTRNLEKSVKRRFKTLQKEAAKGNKKGNRKPSGFAKPSRISDELCDFLGKERGSEVARTEVTQHLIKYIKDHNLQFEGNRKNIVPDDKLSKLLNVQPGADINYFNLQKFMNPHFPKSTKTAEVVAPATA